MFNDFVPCETPFISDLLEDCDGEHEAVGTAIIWRGDANPEEHYVCKDAADFALSLGHTVEFFDGTEESNDLDEGEQDKVDEDDEEGGVFFPECDCEYCQEECNEATEEEEDDVEFCDNCGDELDEDSECVNFNCEESPNYDEDDDDEDDEG